MSDTTTTEVKENNLYITSHLMATVADHLNAKARNDYNDAENLLAALFSQQAILLTAVNKTTREVRKAVGEALDIEVANLGSGDGNEFMEPEPEEDLKS